MQTFSEKHLPNDDIFDAFPRKYHEDLKVVFDFLMTYKFQIHTIFFHKIKFQGNDLCIPYRLYFDTNCKSEITHFSLHQQTLFWCIASRHKDGFFREEGLKHLFNSNQKISCIYTLILASEYVREIIEMINLEIDENNINDYLQVLYEDKSFFTYIKGNIASHWGKSIKYEYPKEKKQYRQYAGKKLIVKLNRAMVFINNTLKA
jgi:hypothetical protein